jgi:predicted dinucleotide-binding enzyme
MAISHDEWAKLEGRVTALEAIAVQNARGVSNFHKFQLDVSKKIAFVHGAAWAWSVILAVFLGAFTWSLHEIAPAIRGIIIDYYLHHPEAQFEQKSLYEPPNQDYASHKVPQSADNSAAFTATVR